jgi:glycosyltransferase involved in cell wall biosynthesis
LNVLYLSYDGMTDPLGQSQVLPYLVGLAKKGCTIHLISFEKNEKFLSNKNTIQQICADNQIIWHPLSYTKKPPIISTLYDIWRLKNLAKKITLTESIQIVHCRSYITSLVGLYLKKHFNLKFIFDMRGLWADERVDAGLWNLKNPIYKFIYKFFKKKEIDFLQKSNHIISLTNSGKKELLNWEIKGIQDSKITVIPCCTDENIFNKESVLNTDIQLIETKLNITKNDYIVAYLGSIGTWYMINEMLDFYDVLFKEKQNAKALFITQHPPAEILNLIKQKKLDSSRFIIYAANRKEVPVLLSICKAAIFFIAPYYSKIASSPTKMGEIMNMGIPPICNNIGDNQTILNQTCDQFMVNNFNADEYKRVIWEIDQLLSEDINKIIATSTAYFSLQNGIENYYQTYLQ